MAKLRYAKSIIFGYGYVDDSHHKWLKQNIPYVFERYMRLYMRHMAEFDCDHTNLAEFLNRTIPEQLCNNILYLRNRYGEPEPARSFSWKFRYHGGENVTPEQDWDDQDHSYTCYIEITKIEVKVPGNPLVEGIISIFDEMGSKSTLFQLSFVKKRLTKAASILGTPMMNMDHQNREKNHLRSLPNFGALPDDVQQALAFGLFLARRYTLDDTSTTNDITIHHEPYEIKVFERALRVANFDNFTATSIITFCYQEYDLHDAIYTETFETPLFMSDYYGQFPLVDLSEKEMRSVTRYLIDRKLCVGNGDHLNLLEYLKEPEFGKELRLPITNYEILFTYLLHEELDFVRFIFGYRCGDMIVWINLDCTNLKDFSIRTSLMRISANLTFIGGHDLFQDYKDMTDLLPEDLKEATPIVSILANALDIYVIGKNRPDRVRITKISKPRKPGLAPKQYEPEEKDYVITRIMRTVRKTRELCKELAEESKRGGNVQYVVESWKRRGYHRRDGVYVSPTICHRHLDLTTKEVHIKL